MALMEVHYYSYSLKSNITFTVLVPSVVSDEARTEKKDAYRVNYEKGLPVLYLLHGAYGDAFSWSRYSNIDRYAQEAGIVVVMPSAENSFYQNLQSGKKYEDFFVKELLEFVQGVFPVSKKKEDTYIAGLSMGGYGAWYLALRHPENYAKAASLSGAVDIVDVYNSRKTTEELFNWQDCFGTPDTLEGSSNDLVHLYQQNGENNPDLYQAVGFSDFLYESNQKIKSALTTLGANLTYSESEGGHEWNFWDKEIQHVLHWIVTDRKGNK